MLKQKSEKSAFLSSLKYALIREVSESSIFNAYIASRAHKLACFAQSHDLVQTNKQTDRQNDLQTKRLLYPSAAHVVIIFIHLCIF